MKIKYTALNPGQRGKYSGFEVIGMRDDGKEFKNFVMGFNKELVSKFKAIPFGCDVDVVLVQNDKGFWNMTDVKQLSEPAPSAPVPTLSYGSAPKPVGSYRDPEDQNRSASLAHAVELVKLGIETKVIKGINEEVLRIKLQEYSDMCFDLIKGKKIVELNPESDDSGIFGGVDPSDIMNDLPE